MLESTKGITKLYIIEGLPGSGKSTTARYVADCLLEQKIETTCYDEGNFEHPADYEFMACLTEYEINSFTTLEQTELKAVAKIKGNDLFVPLHKVQGELFEKSSAL